MQATVVIPTFNEHGNIATLVARLDAALSGSDAELLFVDDSTDETPAAIRAADQTAHMPVTVHHRDTPIGGLSGAVVEGLRDSRADWVVVMDGDLQHPPEFVPRLLDAAAQADGVDIVVASRYRAGGSSTGLESPLRTLASRGATLLARGLFPRRLRGCTDPMSGFFAVRRDAVDCDVLRPRGFKILLEILARHRLHVAEVPFTFGERGAGASKATARQGLAYLGQLAVLRTARPVPPRPVGSTSQPAARRAQEATTTEAR